MPKYITQIARQRIRLLRASLDRETSQTPIRILTTYAPHKGQKEADRKKHWGEVGEIMNKTCKRRMIIWCTDANGHLCRDGGE